MEPERYHLLESLREPLAELRSALDGLAGHASRLDLLPVEQLPSVAAAANARGCILAIALLTREAARLLAPR